MVASILKRCAITIGIALAGTGCDRHAPTQKGAQPLPTKAQDSAPATKAPITAAPTTPNPGPQAIATKNSVYEYEYKWPREAAAIPELNAWLRSNGEKLERDTRSDAQAAKVEAKAGGYDYHGNSYLEDYKVVGNTPRMLVLLSDGYVYTGGAHGMPINTAIIWDRQAKKRLATAAMIDLPRLVGLAKKRFCTELDKQRAEKRGEPVRHDDPNELSDFVQCVDMAKQLILPVSKGGKVLDTIEIVIGPYEAGPYAEGTYVIDLAVDATLMGAVKIPYRDVFGLR